MTDTTGVSADKTWQRWHDEIELARKAKGFDNWQKRSKRIIKRYRDERGDIEADTEITQGAKFNILWSNVQTLMPALFAKSPKPVVERRYLDRDDVGRTASVILERAISYELDDGCYHAAIKKAVLDRLLPGRGVVWVRYEPKFTPMPGKTQEIADGSVPDGSASRGSIAGPSSDRDSSDGRGSDSDTGIGASKSPAVDADEVAAESAPVDYIAWEDFQTSPSRTWEEVWWVSKRVYMTRAELKARFKKGGKVPLDWTPNQQSKTGGVSPAPSSNGQKRAKILEIWDKQNRKVYWMAEGWGEEMLDEQDDPLKLEGFWPCPKPLFATLTNDTLIPIPDYVEYQDQAAELDDLTARISALTKVIKAAGIYDASVPELQRMFSEGFENELVPSDNMSEFAMKAGSTGQGVVWTLPIKDYADTLIQLYTARDQTKQVLYEVTGISDIVRGSASQGGAKTATEQRIKGQFASMRLNDMQAEVARFCRDTLRIMGEIIAEHFDPMTLFEISGFEQYAKEQWPAEEPPPAPPPPQMGHNGGPPMGPPPVMAGAPPAMPPQAPAIPAGPPAGAPMPPPGMMAPMPPPPSPEQVAQAKAADMFKQAIELLRNDKLRGFRIDIETDSIVEPDQQAMQQARTELMGAISQFLPQAIEAGKASPELKPLLARLLMFFLRGFKASRDIEAAFEQFIDDMQKEARNPAPPPPSPEQMKAQAEQQKTQAEMAMQQKQFEMDQQTAMQTAQMDREKQQFEMQVKQQEFELEKQKMQMEFEHQTRMLGLKERDAQIKSEAAERTSEIKGASEVQSAQIQAESMDREGQANERKHELGIEVMEAKAKQAKANPKPNGASK